MNQSNISKKFLKELLKCFTLSIFGLFALFFILSYVLYRIPNFENYYSAFPMTLLVLEGVFLSVLSRLFSNNRFLLIFSSALIISILSFVFSSILYGISVAISKLLFIHLAFLIETAVLLFIFKNKMKIQKKNKNLPFAK